MIEVLLESLYFQGIGLRRLDWRESRIDVGSESKSPERRRSMTRKRKAGEPLLRRDERRVVDGDPTGCRIPPNRCPPSRLWRRQTDGNRFACRQGSSWRGQLGNEKARPVRDPGS